MATPDKARIDMASKGLYIIQASEIHIMDSVVPAIKAKIRGANWLDLATSKTSKGTKLI